VRVFVSGGTEPYFFEWSNGFMGQGVAVIQGASVTAGDYSVTVTDANGCQPPLVVSTTLEDPPSIVVDFSNIDSVSCANGTNCDGGATATAMYSDGTTGLFDFEWFPSQEFTIDAMSSTAVMLCPGIDSVEVSDGVCADTFFVEIPSPPSLGVTADLENVSCNGLSDGSAELTPLGGTSPYTVVWPDGSTDFSIENLAPANYIATITDANDCQLPITIEITEPTPLEVLVEPSGTFNVSCNGYEDGIITVLPTGGNVALNPDGVTYIWSNGVAGTDSPVATDLPAGNYSVTVVDVKGCTDSLTVTLAEPPPIQFQVGDVPEINCAGQQTFVTVDSIWGGGPSQFGFSVNGSFPFSMVGTEIPIFAGEVQVVVADLFNTDCRVEETFFISEPDELMIELPEILEIELGDTTTMLIPEIVPPVPIDSFLWQPSEGLSCTDCKNPIVNITSDQTYTLTIWDINGCRATESITIEIDRNRNVYIPNIFSPNGDGINDKFQIFTGQGVSQINLVKVYDRWGELVFEERGVPLPANLDGTPGWDGRLDGERMNPAVFLYLVEVEFVDGQVLLYRGDVTLVR
jgi:gliding motility-associated-like protein